MDLGLGSRQKMKLAANVTPERQAQIIAKFAGRKKRQYILLVAGTLAIVLAIIANVAPGFKAGPVTQDGFVFSFLGIALAIMVYTRFNWRCPECSIYLGPIVTPKECPRCGVKLKNSPNS